MGNFISIKHNFPQVAKKLESLADDIGNKAVVNALNTTVEQGRKKMAATISNEFRIKKDDAEKRLSVEYARFNGRLRLTASLMATRSEGLFNDGRRGMNLIHFLVGGQPKRTKKGSMRQLSFQIKKSGGRKQLNGAFIATNAKTRGTAIFIREGKARYPIVAKTTIDVPQMFNTRRINEVVRRFIIERFGINFKRELRSVLRVWKK